MPLRRPLAGRCPKAFTLPVSMLSLLILYSVRLITLGSTSQLALEQYKTQLYVTDTFRGTSWMMLLLIFSHCWNMHWTWNQWCSALKCWAVTLQGCCGHPGDLVVERREPALPEVMSCKVACTWVVRNHELLCAYVCSDFNHSVAAFWTAHDLHPGKSHSTLWSHCTWRHLPSAQQCPKFPLEGSLWPVPEIQPSPICLQKKLKHGFEIGKEMSQLDTAVFWPL